MLTVREYFVKGGKETFIAEDDSNNDNKDKKEVDDGKDDNKSKKKEKDGEDNNENRTDRKKGVFKYVGNREHIIWSILHAPVKIRRI